MKACTNPDCPLGPGLLPASRFNLHWAAAGVPYLRAYCKLCQAAADRRRRAARPLTVEQVQARRERDRARYWAAKEAA